MGAGWQRDATAALPAGEIPGTHRKGGCVGSRVGLYGCGKEEISAAES